MEFSGDQDDQEMFGEIFVNYFHPFLNPGSWFLLLRARHCLIYSSI
jgi:hypothetical protein